MPGGKMLMAEYFYDPPNENFDREFKGNLSVTYAYGAHGVEVEVDRETGQVKIVNYVAAHDVGKALNPMLLEGQISGGGVMGIGYALTENMVYKDGRLMNANYLDYKMLTAEGYTAHAGGDRRDGREGRPLRRQRASASPASCRRRPPSQTPSTTRWG